MALTAEQKLNLETLDFGTLSPEELDEAMKIASGEADDGRSEPAPAPAPEIAPAPTEIVPEAAPIVESQSEKEAIAALKAEKFRLASEANKYRQEAEKYKKLATAPAPIPVAEVDVWDSDVQKAAHQDLRQMKAEMESIRAERAEMEAERAKNRIFEEANAVAREFNLPITDVRAMDDKFQTLATTLQRAPTQAEMNAEYQGDKGVDAYFDILSAFTAKQQAGYPTMRAAFKDQDLDSKWKVQGNPDYFVAQSEAQGHRATAQAAAERTKVMNGTYTGEVGELTEAYAEQWLTKNKDQNKWSSKDFETFLAIEKKFLS